MARPTKYLPEYCEQALKLCRLGAKDSELADFFHVNEDTINEWKKVHPEFSESLKEGKALADAEVADKLFKRATGYEHKAVKISANPNGDEHVTEYVERYPPDTTAAIFWLNHIGMPLIGNTDAISFLEHQAISSRTVLSPKGMDWFFGGLNYQIEHHLFPNVPSFRLSRVQPIVQATLAQHSIAYQSAGFREAVRAVAAHFRHVAQADQGQSTP